MNPAAYNHWIEVDLNAVRNNYAKISALAGVPVIAVVKANAYGNGMVACAQALAEAGAEQFAVTTLQEAATLRQAGLQQPILQLCPTLLAQANATAELGITPTIDCKEVLDAFDQAAAQQGKRLPVACKVDTGMARFGIRPEEAAAYAKHISGKRHIYLDQVYSHFANASDPQLSQRQLERLQQSAALFRQTLPQTADHDFKLHLANSTGTVRYPEARLNMVRVGSLLYGQGTGAQQLQLESTWCCKARITAKRVAQKGEQVGYGMEFTVPHTMTIGVIEIGYYDGFGVETRARSESFSQSWQQFSRQVGKLLLKKRRAVTGQGKSLPVLGRIAMQTTVIDLTGTTLEVGDAVEVPMRRTTANPTTHFIYLGAQAPVGESR